MSNARLLRPGDRIRYTVTRPHATCIETGTVVSIGWERSSPRARLKVRPDYPTSPVRGFYLEWLTNREVYRPFVYIDEVAISEIMPRGSEVGSFSDYRMLLAKIDDGRDDGGLGSTLEVSESETASGLMLSVEGPDGCEVVVLERDEVIELWEELSRWLGTGVGTNRFNTPPKATPTVE